MAPAPTRRTSDDTLVAYPDAVKAWAEAARPALEGVAGTYAGLITYEELAKALQDASGIETGVVVRKWIGDVIGEVSRNEAADAPLLTSLVVKTDGTIGVAYAAAVEAREGVAPEDPDMHAARERLACYERYGATIPAHGGLARLTPQEAARRQKAAIKDPPKRPTCPSCFLEVSLNGACPVCGERP